MKFLNLNKFDAVVIGGNFSSLIFCHFLPISFSCVALERTEKKDIENNAAGVLYLHSDMKELGVRVRKIRLLKSIYDDGVFHNKGDLVLMNKYSKKTLGYLADNSILGLDGSRYELGYVFESGGFRDNLSEAERCVVYGKNVFSIDLNSKRVICDDGSEYVYNFLVNTISLPIFLKLCGLKIKSGDDIKFSAADLYLYRKVSENCLVNQCIYIVDLSLPFYRVSVINGVCSFESNEDFLVSDFDDFLIKCGYGGIGCDGFESFFLKGARFNPVNSKSLKTLIRSLTDSYDVFCIGRNATWSYKRIDHIPSDAKKIIGLMEMKREIADKGYFSNG